MLSISITTLPWEFTFSKLLISNEVVFKCMPGKIEIVFWLPILSMLLTCEKKFEGPVGIMLGMTVWSMKGLNSIARAHNKINSRSGGIYL